MARRRGLQRVLGVHLTLNVYESAKPHGPLPWSSGAGRGELNARPNGETDPPCLDVVIPWPR
jgi:hypothetical protein